MPVTLEITTNCPICGATDSVHADPVGYKLWKTGEVLIQDALAHLTLNEREQLMTGICSRCWEKNFGKENEPANAEYELA